MGVAELQLESGRLTPVPLIDDPDVHNYDACYLPDGRIVFTSTAPFTGVPCVGGKSKVANLYLRDHDGSRSTKIRSHQHAEGRLVLQGLEQERAWSILISEETGKMSVTSTGSEAGFVIFGACTQL